MEIFLIKALQLILCFTILITLHEGGHFFFAKLFKVRVEKFCLFFDPWRTLLRFRPRKSETEYCLGWLPLGGYVKISGMIDESMDTEQLKQEPQPWEFRTHPAWQRMLIMAGGVLVNFLLALFIYSMILFAWGEDYIPLRDMKLGMTFNKEARALGFEEHDILLRTDATEFERFNTNENISDVYRSLSQANTVTVLRHGKEVDITMPAEKLNLLDMFRAMPPFVTPYIPTRIDSVMPGGPADVAGIRKGDFLMAFAGQTTCTWSDFRTRVIMLAESLEGATTNDSLRARQIEVVVKRATSGSRDTLSLTLSPDLTMGIYQSSAYSYYAPIHRDYGFFESFVAGSRYGVNTMKGYVSDFKYLFTKEGASSIGSFGAIGSMFPRQWDWRRFWELTAFISIILCFMNVLPIPALDGGHMFFLLVEIVTRRKPSEKFMEYAQMVGMGLLFALMLFAIGNDVVRFLF